MDRFIPIEVRIKHVTFKNLKLKIKFTFGLSTIDIKIESTKVGNGKLCLNFKEIVWAILAKLILFLTK